MCSNPVHAPADDTGTAEAPATPATETPAKAPSKAPKVPKRKPAKKASPNNGPAKAKGAKAPAKKAAPKATAKPAKGKAKKPVTERQRDPAKLDQWGFRKDSIKSKAAAMYAKGNGATLAQVKEVVGSVQFNLLTELQERGFKIEIDEIKSAKGRMVNRYKLHAKA